MVVKSQLIISINITMMGKLWLLPEVELSAGFVSYWDRKIYVTDGFGYEGRSELVTTKYLYYVLKNMETALNAMKKRGRCPTC